MIVFVQHFVGPPVQVKVNLTDKVIDLKIKIKKNFFIDEIRQNLSYKGMRLDDVMLLGDYDIKDGDAIDIEVSPPT